MRALALCLASLLLASCGSGDDTGATPVGQGGAAGAPQRCEDDQAAGASCVLSVRGSVRDEAGSPFSARGVSFCGASLCFNGDVQPDGSYAIPVLRHVDVTAYALLFHGAPGYESVTRPLSGAPVDGMLSLSPLLALARPGGGPLFPDVTSAEVTLEQGDVTVTLPAGTEARLDPAELAESVHFSAHSIPLERLPELCGPVDGALAVYALAPFEAALVDVNGKPVRVGVSFKNRAGLAPGQKVQLLAQGSYVFPQWLTPARFEQVATATVSADGARVVVPVGEGPAYLTWLALRAP